MPITPGANDWNTSSPTGNYLLKFLPNVVTGVTNPNDLILDCGLQSGLPARTDGSTFPGLGVVGPNGPTDVQVSPFDGIVDTRHQRSCPGAPNFSYNAAAQEMTVKDLFIVGSFDVNAPNDSIQDAGGIGVGATSITVKKGSKFPTGAGPYTIWVGDPLGNTQNPGAALEPEVCTYLTRSGDVLSGVTGITRAHAKGEKVTFKVTLVNSGNIWVIDERAVGFVEPITTLAASTDINNLPGKAFATLGTAEGSTKVKYTARYWGTHLHQVQIAHIRGAQLETELADVDPPGFGNDLIFLARTGGAGGESITIEYVDPGVPQGQTEVSVSTNAITVKLARDSNGIKAQARHVRDAIEGTPAADALVRVVNADSGGDGDKGRVTAMAATNLSLVNCARIRIGERLNVEALGANPARLFATYLATNAGKTAVTTAAQIISDFQDNTVVTAALEAGANGSDVVPEMAATNMANGANGYLEVTDASTFSASGGQIGVQGHGFDYAGRDTSTTPDRLTGVQFSYISSALPYFWPEPGRVIQIGSAVKVIGVCPVLGIGQRFNTRGGAVSIGQVGGELSNLFMQYPNQHPALTISGVRGFKLKHYFIKFAANGDLCKIFGGAYLYGRQNGTYLHHPACEVGETGIHLDANHIEWLKNDASGDYNVIKEFVPTGRHTYCAFTSGNVNPCWYYIYKDCVLGGIQPKGAGYAWQMQGAFRSGMRDCHLDLSAVLGDEKAKRFIHDQPEEEPVNINNLWDNGVKIPGSQNEDPSTPILTFSPADGEINVPVTTPVDVFFDQAMDESTMIAANFTLRDFAGATVAKTFAYDAGLRRARSIPNAPLAYANEHTLTVTGGVNGIKTALGGTMPSDALCSFTTENPPTAPVFTVSPADLSQGQPITSNMIVDFSTDMDPATMIAANFELRDEQGALVSTDFAFDAPTDVVTKDPLADLAYDTTYTGKVVGGAGGVKTLAGGILPGNFTWSFTTQQQSGGTIPPERRFHLRVKPGGVGSLFGA